MPNRGGDFGQEVHFYDAVELPGCDFHLPAEGFEGYGVDNISWDRGFGAGDGRGVNMKCIEFWQSAEERQVVKVP